MDAGTQNFDHGTPMMRILGLLATVAVLHFPASGYGAWLMPLPQWPGSTQPRDASRRLAFQSLESRQMMSAEEIRLENLLHSSGLRHGVVVEQSAAAGCDQGPRPDAED
jgi:hypothetical protein